MEVWAAGSRGSIPAPTSRCCRPRPSFRRSRNGGSQSGLPGRGRYRAGYITADMSCGVRTRWGRNGDGRRISASSSRMTPRYVEPRSRSVPHHIGGHSLYFFRVTSNVRALASDVVRTIQLQNTPKRSAGGESVNTVSGASPSAAASQRNAMVLMSDKDQLRLEPECSRAGRAP